MNNQGINWTPTDVALPEKEDEYLVTFKCSNQTGVNVFYYSPPLDDEDTHTWFDSDCTVIDNGAVLAWAYLPEPYKEVIK